MHYTTYEELLRTRSSHLRRTQEVFCFLQQAYTHVSYLYLSDSPDYRFIEVEGYQPFLIDGDKYDLNMKWLITWDFPKVAPQVTFLQTPSYPLVASHPNIDSAKNACNLISINSWRGNLQELHNEMLTVFQKNPPIVCLSLLRYF